MGITPVIIILPKSFINDKIFLVLIIYICMKLSIKEVEHIAKLARLHLSDEDAILYSQQMSDILDYVEKLQAVDTDGVEETSQVTGLINVMREDKIEESNISDELVECAPEHGDGYIKVPKIL